MSTSSSYEPWRLPDGVDELLPPTVRRLESLRQSFLELGGRWGFAPVSPPLIESLDGLLTGTGEVMQRETFQIVDQVDGRMLGVRADMTTQVARMDAHALATDGPNRLLYTGTVLRTRADGIGASRNPQQFGAELFGHAGPESDIEVVRLMIETVLLTGVAPADLVLDLGHVGVYTGLVEHADLDDNTASRLFDAIVRGSVPDARIVIDDLASGDDSVARARAALRALSDMRGDGSVVQSARASFGQIDAQVTAALARLDADFQAIKLTHPDIRLHVDLSELRGYRYHTGLLFAVHDQDGQQLARGGRYDAVGEAFGSARAATGFSGDLKRLSNLVSYADSGPDTQVGIQASDLELPGAWAAVARLRASGQAVVTLLPDAARPIVVTARLVRNGNDWTTRAFDDC